MDGSGLPETRSTCPYCGVGCGVLLRPDGKRGVAVRGDPDHPANLGRLCSKGTALGETVGLDGRILEPMVQGKPASWDTALTLVANKFKAAIADHGPDSVAFYVSGQMLTEDYYVANKLMKGFIGSANIDTNSRLCMASTVAGHRRAFGTDTVPGTYEDLEQADLIVLVGSNLAWCHPVLFQRIVAAKAANPALKVITVDPRRTATTDLADLHLPLAPGSDVALFNHLLVAIADGGQVTEYATKHVTGLDAALTTARADDATAMGLTPHQLAQFTALWTKTEKVVTVFSQGVNQSTSGTDKVNAIINCHLATGRIGRPGMGPFSVTGQPNAMGGREVGGLANMLACHLEIENSTHRDAVQTFWDAPTMATKPGLKAVDMFRAVADKRIKALWIICTNPAASMPEADAVRAAIAACDFVVVSDCSAETDTAKLAHVILPATTWGEKDGTVTNSDRTVSRQRSVLPKPGKARHDWDILADVGRRMGWPQAFDYTSPAQIFREHAALSGVAGALGADFDISGLVDTDYDTQHPTRWPVSATKTGGRFFGDGQFHTPDGKARMLPLTHRAPISQTTEKHPFRLNTGRNRDQWHTMTRSGKSARLSQHLAEPFVEIHPSDAAQRGIHPAHLVQVSNDHGTAILRVLITDRVQPGQVFAPMHWTDEYSAGGRINALVAGETDPISGQPELKAAMAQVVPYAATWYGFAVSANAPHPTTPYSARARVNAGWRMELADTEMPADWDAYARALFALPDAVAHSVIDRKRGLARIALHQNGILLAALFTGPNPVAVSRDHLAGLLGQSGADVLAGRPGADQPDPGPTLCACFGIGVNTILTAIEQGGLMTVAQIGTALGAGTNCGSCRPELAALLARTVVREAAE